MVTKSFIDILNPLAFTLQAQLPRLGEQDLLMTSNVNASIPTVTRAADKEIDINFLTPTCPFIVNSTTTREILRNDDDSVPCVPQYSRKDENAAVIHTAARCVKTSEKARYIGEEYNTTANRHLTSTQNGKTVAASLVELTSVAEAYDTPTVTLQPLKHINAAVAEEHDTPTATSISLNAIDSSVEE